MAQFTMMTDDECDMLPLSDEQRNIIKNFTPVSPLLSERPSLIHDMVRHLRVKRAINAPPEDKMEVYTLIEGFVPQDRYWKTKLRYNRMEEDSPVLYRPNIVNKLVDSLEALLNASKEKGIMVKGPQGVGKSFSIVNLVRKLLSSDQYVVTFIPNCDRWRSLVDLYWFILSSVGVDESSFGIKYGLDDVEKTKHLKDLIRDIDEILKVIGKRWVFVFDQINRIFAKSNFERAKMVGDLPFPYEVMQSVMVPGRIISIISASANNEASYKDHHDGFEEFEHDIALSTSEIRVLFPEASSDMLNVEHYTGYIPLFVRKLIEAGNIELYLEDVSSEMAQSLNKLNNQSDGKEWKSIASCAIAYLLRIPKENDAWCYDRKYSYAIKRGNSVFIEVLFPMVEEQYRLFFWNDFMQYVKAKEANLLAVCNDRAIANDVRGRLFEAIALRRLASKGLLASDIVALFKKMHLLENCPKFGAKEALFPAGSIEYIKGNAYPTFFQDADSAWLYIPLSPNFPAVDAIVRIGDVVITFQMHITRHEDVKSLLLAKALSAGWFPVAISTVILVYLSPACSISQCLSNILKTPTQSKESGRATRTEASQHDDVDVFTFFCSTDEFTTIGHIPWNLE